MANPDDVDLEDLLERCILAIEEGDQALVERLQQDHPQHAEALRSRLAQLAALGILQAPTAPALPEHLGEFRLLRQLGRGGMGVVYLAEQTSLQRRVALKLVHPEQRFFPGARERFRREVLAVARLQHPGIVPVLLGGEHDGLPYYAMELVAGASLAEILHELAGVAPAALDGGALRAALQRAMAKKHDLTAIAAAPVFDGAWPAVCCRLVLDAAAALEHAHSQGILHRDVKPSNLLLDTNGRVRLVDFGLASIQGDARITRSGAAFGSLPYMAPEQLRGDLQAIDARTDTYALGVTLYELLTLTLPHGDGSGTTRERILQGVVEPPTRRNTKVHPDLEAVCLLAMDVDRGRRYPTAAALADDLRAFLDNRSVRARRPSLLLRLHRAARRRPGRAAALLVGFLLLGPGPLVFGVQQSFAATRIEQALHDAEAASRRARDSQQEAERQAALAEQNFAAALAAVDQMLVRVSTERLSLHPRTAKLRAELLGDAVGFYEQLLARENAADAHPQAALERARTQVRLAALRTDLGDAQTASQLLESAIATFTRHAGQPDATAFLQGQLANAHYEMARLSGRLDRLEPQVEHARISVDLYDDLRAAQPKVSQLATNQRLARMTLANGLGRMHRYAEAHAELDRVVAEVGGDPPADLSAEASLQWRLAAVEATNDRAVLWAEAGESEKARDGFRASITRIEALSPELQQDEQVRGTWLNAVERLGLSCQQRREWPEAQRWFEAAREALAARSAKDPERIDLRARLAVMLGSLATCRTEQRDLQGAGADHDRAIELLQGVVREAPDEPQHRRRLAIAFAERAGFHAANRDQQRARADLETADQEFTAIEERFPAGGTTRANHAAVLANLARVLAESGDLPGARQRADAALLMVEDRVAGEVQRSRIELRALAADLAMRENDGETGKRHMAVACELVTDWLAQRPTDPLRQGTAAMIQANYGIMQLQLGDHPAAKATWQAALPTARAAAAQSPFGRQTLAILLLRLCDVATRDGDTAAARDWFGKALAETRVQKAMLQGQPKLQALFDREDLRDLVPTAK